MITHEVKEVISVIGENKGYEKRLSLISWNGEPAKLDLRTWKLTGSGDFKPGRGITLSDQEALLLDGALIRYLDKNRTPAV